MTNDNTQNDESTRSNDTEQPSGPPDGAAPGAPDPTTPDGAEEPDSLRRRAFIAGTLGSPAVFGLGFAAADGFALPNVSSSIGIGSASPTEQAAAGSPTVAQMDRVAVTVDERPAQDVPTNRYRRLHVAQSVLDTIQREVGDQVRVTRGRDSAVYTITETTDADESIVQATSEGKCRLAFYEDGTFADKRRWGPLRGDDTCDLAGEAFEVEIDPRVPAVDPNDAAARTDELVEHLDSGGTKCAVLAPHGGQIQPFTSQQVRRVGTALPDSAITTWMLEGYGRDTGFYRWHVPSAEISTASYPRLAELSERTYDRAVSFHGISENVIYVGGAAPEGTRRSVVDAIDSALPHDGSPVRLGEGRYAADGPRTLVNRVTDDRSNGIWIGQPIADRRDYGDLIADAVGSALLEE